MSAHLTSVQQESIYHLFSAKDSFFVIPDYQRPYAGKMMNAPHFGMIFAVLRCLTEIFIAMMMNIF